MICPECNTSYTDEYLYCLSDGTQLIDDGAEVPTVIRTGRAETAAFMVACPGCGLPNKAGARFCKRCGKHFTAAPGELPAIAVPMTIPILEAPRPAAADSPPSPIATAGPRRSPLPFVLMTAGAILLAVVVAVVAYNLGSGGPAANNTAANNANRAAVNANSNIKTPTPPANAASNSNAAADPLIGRTGTLTTDVNLRDSPDRNSAKVGTHYNGARVRILGTAEVPNDEGTTSIWYHVTVTSYGTSADPNNYGLGKDPGSLDEGWINSYPKVWDNAKRAQVHKRTVNFDEP